MSQSPASPLEPLELLNLAEGLKIAYETGFIDRDEAKAMFRMYAQPPEQLDE